MIYLDNSATTKPYDEVLDEYNRISKEVYFNPSALHTAGIYAERETEKARKQIYSLMEKKKGRIIFTSGGTESDNMAILGAVYANKNKGNHIITTKIEHKAVLNACEYLEKTGYTVSYIGVNKDGVVDLEELKNAITDKTVLISVMLVNNETGVVQPLNAIKEIAGDIIVHTDAIQGFGKVSLKDIDADLISVSSHKIHGPKGVGALYIKDGVKITNINFGGGQEYNLRSGTLNVPGIVGFGKAAEIAYNNFENNVSYLKNLREYVITSLKDKIENVYINGDESSVNIISAAFDNVRGEVLLHELENSEIYVSTGSACNSKNTKVSYVLDAMKVKHNLAEGTVRISLSVMNTKEEIDEAVLKISEAVSVLRKFKRR